MIKRGLWKERILSLSIINKKAFSLVALLFCVGILFLNDAAAQSDNKDHSSKPLGIAFVVPFLAPEVEDYIEGVIAKVDAQVPQVYDLSKKSSIDLSNFSGSNNIVVALGKASFLRVSKSHPELSILTVFTTSYVFEEALRETGYQAQKHSLHRYSAIYSQPSALQQLRLIRSIYPANPVVAMVLPTAHRRYENQWVTAAQTAGVRLLLDYAKTPRQLFKALRKIDKKTTAKIDAVLIEPNELYSAHIRRNIISSSLHQGRAVFGYSEDVVASGAVASVYSDLHHVINESALILERYSQTGVLPKPGHSTQFDIAIHERVAQSLNLVLPSKDKIKQELSLTDLRSAVETKKSGVEGINRRFDKNAHVDKKDVKAL